VHAVPACMQAQHARRSELDKQHSKVRHPPAHRLSACLPARRRAAETTAGLRQGAASGGEMVDCGSMCMPGAAEKVQELVDDAVRKGAKVGREKTCYSARKRAIVGGCLYVFVYLRV
jgi:hypothetical protein